MTGSWLLNELFLRPSIYIAPGQLASRFRVVDFKTAVVSLHEGV
jgi:hypothetical protein